MTTNMNRDSRTGQYQKKVPDRAIVREIKRSRDPVVTASEVANRLGLKRNTILRRLGKLKNKGAVDRKDVGARAVVWWVKD